MLDLLIIKIEDLSFKSLPTDKELSRVASAFHMEPVSDETHNTRSLLVF